MRVFWKLKTEIGSRHYLPVFFLLVTVLWSLLNSTIFHYYPPIGAYIAGLALGAAVVTIWPPQTRWAKVAWIVFFLLITVFEIRNLYHDRAESEARIARAREEADERAARAREDADQRQAEAERKLAETFAGVIRGEQAGFNKILGTNQKQFAKTMKSARETLDTATGGDSYCYMDIVGFFRHVGDKPLYGINVMITDFTNLEEAFAPNSKVPLMGPYQIELGEMAPGSTRQVTDPVIRWGGYGETQENFRVFFQARNGFWYEDLQYQVCPDHVWRRALRVFRGHVGKEHGLLLTEIDKDFPTQHPTWHK